MNNRSISSLKTLFIYVRLLRINTRLTGIVLNGRNRKQKRTDMLTIFGRKKLTTERAAHVFSHNIIETVESGFADVAGFINDSPEFVTSPNIQPDDYGKFLMIVIAGNFSYITQYFSEGQDKEIIEACVQKLAPAFGMTPIEFSTKVKEYKECMSRANHPSKNIIYAMSKGVFVKYELADYQEEYFRLMKTPNPIFLKNLDDLMKNFLLDWEAFNEKYKIVSNA